MKLLSMVLVLVCLAPQGAAGQTVIPAEDLHRDLAILREAFEALHPGLYRYNDTAAMEQHFEDLGQQFLEDRSLRDAYLCFSRFLARIRCGHTYCNFWNQNERVQREVFQQQDKVPFAFQLVDRRMLVTGNATQDERLQHGTEILSLDSRPVRSILEDLLAVVAADGSNDAKRLVQLEVSGWGEFEAFDVYFPLLFPPVDGTYLIEARALESGDEFRFSAPAVTRVGRRGILEERYGAQPSTHDELWEFSLLDDTTALLRLGTFVTWQMEMDWRQFLRDSFQEIEARSILHLILDIRGNEGGADEVVQELYKYLLSKPVELDGIRQLLRYRRVPEKLAPYLDTWDPTFKDRTGQLVDAGDGFFTFKGGTPEKIKLPASASAFKGQVLLLVDAANSSATFQLALTLKQSGRATLVGQTTGGSRRGINGGQMFFLRLPHSGIEMDLPLIGYFPLSDAPDAGVLPDVLVKRTVEDVVLEFDAVLEAALERRVAPRPSRD